MKRLLTIFLAVLVSGVSSRAAETALSALRALPETDARNIVRIAARDGLSSPEHWYFTVYDPEAPAFLRTLVVAKGEVVTSQEVPFAEAAGVSRELLGSTAIKVDSDQAANLALAYAAANQAKVSFLDYQLARQGAKAVPVWIVTCLDQENQSLGSLVITAGRGNVVASDGFPKKPSATQAKEALQVSLVRPTPAEASVVAGIDPRVAVSDQEFLQSQAREIAESPRIEGLPPSTDLENWGPPIRADIPAPVTTAKGSKKSKGKATPAPVARVTGLEDDLEMEALPGIVVASDDDDDFFYEEDLPKKRASQPAKRRSSSVRVSSSSDLPREVRQIRRFIQRVLPF